MILGVMLIRNEDIWLDQAIRAIRDFCDDIIIINNHSIDGSIEIAKKYYARIIDISDLRYTHDIIVPYVGTNTWIFGIDGDEIYNPAGLLEVRRALIAGEFDNSFQITGRFLHVTSIDKNKISGYMGPPAHAPTKLYNFAALESWPTDHKHSLFHSRIRSIKPGISMRNNHYQNSPWEQCPLRCLHMRFMRRSTQESSKEMGVRLSGEDTLGFGSKRDRGGRNDRNERMSYQVGEIVEVESWL